MKEVELLKNVYPIVMKIPETEDTIAVTAFLSSLEDAIMGYSLSELVLEEMSVDNLMDIIADFHTGELKEPYLSDMMSKGSNVTDYTEILLNQVKRLTGWFCKEQFDNFSVIYDNYVVRDIQTMRCGNFIIVSLIGEKQLW